MSDTRNDLPSPSSTNFEQRVRETLMTYMGRQGNPMDRGLTMRDMLDAGLIALKDGAKLTTGMSTLPIKSGPNTTADTTPDLTPPPTPTGFDVAAGMSFIMVKHDPATFVQGHGYLRTVVYGLVREPGAAAPVFADAVKLSEFTGTPGSIPSEPATTWHLWIKWETNDGVLSADPAGGTNGLVATTGQDVAKLLEALTGEITASQLYGDLSARIDLVDGPTTMIGSVAARLRAESEAGARALTDKAAALQGAIDQAQLDFTTKLGTEASTRIAAISAETTERGRALLAQATALGASITAVDTQRQTDADSFAKSITTLTSGLGDAQGAISTEVSTRTTNEGVVNRAITAMGGRVGTAESWITSTTQQTIDRDKVVNESLQATESAIKNPVTGLVATHSLLTNYYSTTLTANSYVDVQVKAKAAELTNPQTGIIASAISSNQIYTQLEADSATKSQIEDFAVKINDPKTGMLSKATNSKTIYSKADADTAMTAAVQVLRAEFVPPGADAISIADYTDKVIAKSDKSGAAVEAANALKAELLDGKPGVPPLLISRADIERTYTTSANKSAAEAITAAAVKTAFEDATTGLVAKAITDKQIYSKTDANSAMTTEINRVFTKFVDPATNSVSTAKMETELFTSNTAKEAIATEVKNIGADFLDESGKMSTAKVGNAILTSATATDAIATAVTNYRSDTGKSLSQISVSAETAASDTSKLKTQYAVKMEAVGANGELAAAGFGMAIEPDGNTGLMRSQFLVKADSFAIVSPGKMQLGFTETMTNTGVSVRTPNYVDAIRADVNAPFIVHTTPQTINGRVVPPGVYMASAFIRDGEITNAKIGVATIDSANIKSLDATLLTAGTGTIGNILKSENYSATEGWQIDRYGTAIFNTAVVRGTVYATDGQFNGEVIAADTDATGDYARMYSGNFEVHRRVPATGADVTYMALSRLEIGVGDNGVRVTIPGYFKTQPKILVSPANITLYDPRFPGQAQSIQCQALDVLPTGPGTMQWAFTPKATLSLAGNTGLAVINQTSGAVAADKWYSSEYTTPANTESIKPTVILGSNRGNGVSQYLYRSVWWRVEYFNGSVWIDSMAPTSVNLPADLSSTVTSDGLYAFPSAGTWKFRICFTAYDTNGGVFGSAAYDYQTLTFENKSEMRVSTDDLAYGAAGKSTKNYAVTASIPSGWSIIGGQMLFAYSGSSSNIELAEGWISGPNINPNTKGTVGGTSKYSTSSNNFTIEAGRTSANGNLGSGWLVIYAATFIVRISRAIANTTTPSNTFNLQSYAYTMSLSSVLANGSLNWVAIGA